MKSILIKNGTLIHSLGPRSEDILIQGEKIVRVGQNLQADSQTQVIDASGKLIFPGVIDPHTHMGIPIKSGFSADDFARGSRSAIHGGVTTILDFTVLEAGQSLSESLAIRSKAAEESLCDVGLHINITRYDSGILDEIPTLIQKGFNSFKVFTTYEESQMMLSYEQIESVAQIIGKHDGILMVHSEDNTVITKASEPYAERTRREAKYHALSRPADAESVAIRRLGEISERSGCTIYIVHLNTEAGLEIASEYPNLKVETCPHYLLLTDEVYEQEDGRMFVASPPLRKAADQDALWQGIQSGLVHTIGSDHCPFCVADKAQDTPFQDISNGMGGVETLFPTLLAQFIARGLDLSLLSRLTSANAAEIFGLDASKGAIEVEKDADLLIVDSAQILTNWKNLLHTSLDWNAYSEFPAIFPEFVIRRGEILASPDYAQGVTLGKLLRASPR